ncbi:MAG: DUF5677 domain-containing protein [Gammaproteobacteria bacterium]|nr:DUF5677 domain-containing protein [Gammaproteobacteria bacterium]
MNTKYRSNVRDEPRFLNPSVSSDQNELSDNKTGLLDYRSDSDTFIDIFNSSLEYNNVQIESNCTKEINRLKECFNYQYELASQYMWLIDCPVAARISPVNKVITPCFHKSLISLISAYHLTKQGLWGAARPLIRHAFESLIIAKYCSVNNESEVFDKWVDGVDLYFSNAILKNIKNPSNEQFKHFWKLLCHFSHSTVFASQPDFYIKPYVDDIRVNFVFIEMLMECSYHLLISHIITSDMKYYQSRYKDKDRASELRQLLRTNYSLSKKSMTVGAKTFIKNYRATWSIKV